MTQVLVTGNRGYIGSVLVPILQEHDYETVGYDTGYYDDSALPPVPEPKRQITKDTRDVSIEDLAGIDAVIHLAALSNDPLGELSPGLTEEINRDASILIGKLAKQAGVKRFVYASSQSMYGIADANIEVEEATGNAQNAITSYARTKWEAEVALKKLNDDNFTVVCMRPSTVYGASPRLRSDIVYNNLVGCAYTTGKIEIKSDGSPWRPVVHVEDVSNAFIAGLEAPVNLVAGESFNVGVPSGNYTVRDLAEAAQRAVPDSTLVFTGEHKDNRSYRVSFKKIFSVLKDYYKPQWNLDKGGKELVEFFKKINFTEERFRGRDTVRLRQISQLRNSGKLDKTLRWK
ncbi:MAG: UDP-glucose 4-epimerase [Parcubacteria group bacterium GW2011_GWA2_51_10]|nr:MAG: UDP-glucose 4-epimerase [Parcubacteria group bacterium GW2011_GWA2_51_10]